MRRSISAAWIVRSLPIRSCSIVCSERMRAAYAHAVEAGYRFYSYGDASLLFPAEDAA